jgi:peptidase E
MLMGLSMNCQQPAYLLAGGRGRKILNTFTIARNIIKSTGKKKPLVAYVGAASLKDNWLIYSVVTLLIRMGCPCKIERVLIAHPRADLVKAKAILRNADVIFISGGDVEVGMQILSQKNMIGYFRDLACQGKLFMGISAGSIMLSKEWVRWRDPRDDSSVELLPCLGIVPLICDTHAEKDGWSELRTALHLKGAGTVGYGISSGAFLKAYPDGRLEAPSGLVTCYACDGDQITRKADLVSEDNASPNIG